MILNDPRSYRQVYVERNGGALEENKWRLRKMEEKMEIIRIVIVFIQQSCRLFIFISVSSSVKLL